MLGLFSHDHEGQEDDRVARHRQASGSSLPGRWARKPVACFRLLLSFLGCLLYSFQASKLWFSPREQLRSREMIQLGVACLGFCYPRERGGKAQGTIWLLSGKSIWLPHGPGSTSEEPWGDPSSMPGAKGTTVDKSFQSGLQELGLWSLRQPPERPPFWLLNVDSILFSETKWCFIFGSGVKNPNVSDKMPPDGHPSHAGIKHSDFSTFQGQWGLGLELWCRFSFGAHLTGPRGHLYRRLPRDPLLGLGHPSESSLLPVLDDPAGLSSDVFLQKTLLCYALSQEMGYCCLSICSRTSLSM